MGLLVFRDLKGCIGIYRVLIGYGVCNQLRVKSPECKLKFLGALGLIRVQGFIMSAAYPLPPS